MRFVRYLHSGVESYGLLSDGEIINLQTLADIPETLLPSTIEELMGFGEEGMRTVEQLMLNSTKTEKGKATLKIGDATFLAPVSSPPKIICLGLNYRDHAEEAGADIPDEPIIFMKPRTAIVGPDEPIIRPNFVKELDY